MNYLKQFLDLTGYQISSCFNHQWQSVYGFPCLCYDNDKQGFSVSILFDKDQETVELSISDYNKNKEFVWYDKKYAENLRKDAEVHLNMPILELKTIELELVQDFWEKAKAIVEGKEYNDDSVLVNFTIDNDLLMTLFKKAHELDMKFNDYVVSVVTNSAQKIIDEEENHC